MKDAFIGLGANIEQPADQLIAACRHLASLKGSILLDLSKVYRSAPMGPQDQPDFLNACAHMKTALEPEALLRRLQEIENTMGRNRVRHWGERCIDLDLLLYEGAHVDTASLQLPHPEIRQRAFVLQPLADLVGPDFVVPNGGDIATLLSRLKDQSVTATQINLKTEVYSGTAC